MELARLFTTYHPRAIVVSAAATGTFVVGSPSSVRAIVALIYINDFRRPGLQRRMRVRTGWRFALVNHRPLFGPRLINVNLVSGNRITLGT